MAIQLTNPNHHEIDDIEFDIKIAKQPQDCAALLKTIRQLVRKQFKNACDAFKDALSIERTNIFGKYKGLYLLVLRLADRQGYGDKLLTWMDEQGLTDRYWPLRAAFDAYLHGEERLLDVNPEVRGAAKHIYNMLDAPRRYREKSLPVKPTQKRWRKKTVGTSTRRASNIRLKGTAT